MSVKYVSLYHIAQRMGVYESMPVPIQGALRRSVTLTLITNIIAIPFLWFAPSLIESVYPVSSDGFFIWFTGDVADFLLRLSYHLSDYLLVLNILSLVMIGIVLLTSKGMERPVSESVHWLGWLAAFPSGITMISTTIIMGLFIAIIVVAIIIWVIIITFAIMALFSALTAMAESS